MVVRLGSLLIFVFLVVSPSSGSFINGYTRSSCISLIPPGHLGVNAQPNSYSPNLTVSTGTSSYVPGKEYIVTLDEGDSYGMKAFMIQGRVKGVNKTAGTFSNTAAELIALEAQLLNCTAPGDSITNYNPLDNIYPKRLLLKWTAPNPSVGDVCLHSSVVEAPNFWFKLQAVCLSPDLSTPPPPTSPGPTISTSNLPTSAPAATTQSIPTTQPAPATTVVPQGQRVQVSPSKLEASLASSPKFDCLLLGTPTPTFRDWKVVHSDGTRISAGVRNPHVIPNVQFGDQGIYECEATGSGGQVLVASGELVIKEKPSITQHPDGTVFVLGNRTDNIIMSCDGIGGNPLTYSWIKDGLNLVGQTGKSLTLPPVKASAGAYECRISNPYGNARSRVAQIVVHIAPYFTVQPRSYDANAGSVAFFTCKADGNPKPSIHWVKDGNTLNDQTREMLGFANVELSHEGEYWCRATNLVRTVDSKRANLTVVIAPPTFSTVPQNTTVHYGAGLNLTCSTHGYPQPQIQWLKDGAVLLGKTGGLLSVRNVTDADAGQYSCNATNSIGSTVSKAAKVTIYKEAPSFTVEPLGGRIFAGESHNFQAVARGVPHPTFSWYKQDVLIPGATLSNLLIEKATLSDKGIYFCRLTNIVGSIDSTKVYLIVNEPPTTEAPTTTPLPTTEKPTTAQATSAFYPTTQSTMAGSGSEPETEATSSMSPTPSTPEATLMTTNTTVLPTGEGGESSTNIVTIIAPVFAVLAFIIIILVVLLAIQRQRQKLGSPRRKSGSLDKLVLTSNIDGHNDALSTDGDRVHMTALQTEIKSADLEQLLGRTPTYIHRISKSCPLDGPSLRTLLERVQEHKENALDDQDEITKQFEETPSNMVTIQKTPAGTESKNRYMNVLPNPHSAVHLEVIDDDPTTSYINANYVRGYGTRPKEYIATQGPIPSTRDDFWRMIWEQNVTAIAMTTGLVERGRMKCCRYWPDVRHENKLTYGNVSVRVVEEIPGPNFTVTALAVRNLGADGDLTDETSTEERIIKHYWFTAWPDFGIPKDSGPMLEFIFMIRKEITPSSGPLLVHCSAGIGRTGTFAAVDIGMQQYDKEGKVDPLMYLCMLRQDRGGSIQTADQYLFVHQALADYIDLKSKNG